ncbi:MAG: type II toxin-antitoxin system HicB family antitoxin [Halodesulfurarchaeum sp.]|nr:type II toxin-antitoxin system HicB family antitoxin [Halodesulfurarchaeum sp.]
MSVSREIHLTEGDDWWTAVDVDTGVASQGKTPNEAVENLEEAVALHDGEIGHAPTDEELRELGVDPENARTQGEELPDVLQ